jgi:hypothetical protein
MPASMSPSPPIIIVGHLQGLQIKSSVKTCDCEAAYVKRVKAVKVVVVAPHLQRPRRPLT